MKLYNGFLTVSAMLLLAAAAVSCSNKEDDIFDQSAAVRMDAAKAETKALLVKEHAPAGWELSYFADNDWESGYVILMKFNNDESVEMAGSNAWVANAFMSTDRYAVQRETSLYKMISDDGPVLTFDTFNKMLHIFSSPYNLPSSKYNIDNVPFPEGPLDDSGDDVNENGYGHNGDYEFVIMSKSADEIILRGKKTRVNMRMRRLAPDTDWDQYFAQANNRAANTFSNRFGDLKMVVDGHELHLSNLSKGVMHIVADDDDPVMETVKIPFLYTPDGIRLREPYKGFEDRLADLAIQNFTFNDDGTLSCTDRPVEFALNSSYPEIFGMSTFSWNIDFESATGAMKTLIDETVAGFTANNSYQGLQYLYFNYNAMAKRYALTMRVKRVSSLGSLYGDYTYGEDGTIKMSFSGHEGDNNGVTRTSRVPAMQQLLAHISSVTWKVTTNSPMAPERLYFTNVNDSSEQFIVNLR
ncbi:DUF4302 domain-containing protein [uncultured Muribaculum sp.]|uniref:DUF4302 domain-containing protein n=1 Tax=uncultured Muribaculum sp. TaxID=1918613 RepID=UPI0025E846A4|nr:DUF4302 domain-containing protein [uncultured Muribaculum sp.]